MSAQLNDIERALAMSHYREGFRLGAIPSAQRWTTVQRTRHQRGGKHYLAGFEAGRKAAAQALAEYGQQLKEMKTP